MRGPCSERAPSWQDLRAMHSRKAICGAFRIHGAQNLPRIAARECMARISCHRRMLGNASRVHFAIGGRSKTHRARILPWQGTWERPAPMPRPCLRTASRRGASARTRLSPRRRNAERCRRAGRVGLRAMAYPPIALHPPPTVPTLSPLRGAGALLVGFALQAPRSSKG